MTVNTPGRLRWMDIRVKFNTTINPQNRCHDKDERDDEDGGDDEDERDGEDT